MVNQKFYVFSHTNWIYDDIKNNTNSESSYQIIKSYGLDAPQEMIEDEKNNKPISFWAPSEFAAKLQKIGSAQNLSAPPPDFLSQLPYDMVERTIITTTLQTFKRNPFKRRFIKPAEAKIEKFPAQTRTYTEFLTDARKASLPDTLKTQTSTPININWEHRLYILDGAVYTGSAYLVNNTTVYDTKNMKEFQKKLVDATAYAQDILPDIPHQPRAYTLDVGINKLTNNWVVIEANPAWCSAFYNSTIEEVLDTITVSCNEPNPEYLWKTDEWLQHKLKNYPLLKTFSQP